MKNLVQSFQNSIDSLHKAEGLVTEQLRIAVINAINETAREQNDEESARELLNYLTDTFRPEPVFLWVNIIKYTAQKKSGNEILGHKTTEKTVVLRHSYFMGGSSEFLINRKFLTALVAKITEE